jgi:hypothetical protein
MLDDANVGPYHPNVVAAGAVASLREVGGDYLPSLMRRLEALAVLATLVERPDEQAPEAIGDAE